MRFGIVAFKDYGDEYGPEAVRVLPLTTDTAKLQKAIDDIAGARSPSPTTTPSAPPARASLSPLALLSLAVPGSLLALGILALPAPRWLIDTNAGLVFGYAAKFAAIAMIVLFAAWLRQSPASDLAARVHGVYASDRFLRLTLPARGPAVALAFVLVALLAVAELEMSLILIRPGPTTLGVLLYTQIHTAPDQVVAALAVDLLIAVGMVALGVALAAALGRRVVRGRSNFRRLQGRRSSVPCPP